MHGSVSPVPSTTPVERQPNVWKPSRLKQSRLSRAKLPRPKAGTPGSMLCPQARRLPRNGRDHRWESWHLCAAVQESPPCQRVTTPSSPALGIGRSTFFAKERPSRKSPWTLSHKDSTVRAWTDTRHAETVLLTWTRSCSGRRRRASMVAVLGATIHSGEASPIAPVSVLGLKIGIFCITSQSGSAGPIRVTLIVAGAASVGGSASGNARRSD